ncbi:MAG TPA: hypothetical protein VK784_02905, partial [Pseudonocardiaceae bacterium]|nr:hypothetical protein [Pseudonocardiaceae bacterium]
GLDRARETAGRVTPVARNASESAVQGVQSAREWAVPRIGRGARGAREWAAPRIERGVRDTREWATPRIERGVHSAREWAAPRIDQAAHAVEETVAPKVSGVLTATARRVDPSTGTSSTRRWLRVAGGLALLSALGGVIVAIARKRGAKVPDVVMPEDEMTQAEAEHTPEADESSDQVTAEVEIGVNGRGPAS